mmetsp:Transcript_9122/g.13732  ORF Transcript_9122/g.13732 Transcript_9122/m.13732 type:complete len:855 (-) Transcript_9122:168-2732(-)|eukprot:CAMPEP_0185028352 /NCGR_PEP_ID=MMETSP1103-20130426/13978_1 /TAXON_ID=36769 /ORGANISM="Paraphysomonas bandaiensis, Strain Caron Lab Isolate" /LENGTH=854 /DNA_ID=CAMNT_0027562737 /DNA_START=28 /DNA_END=2592 /DNA_ORIENTATION=+
MSLEREKTNPLQLVNEIVVGIYAQISGLEHELSTSVHQQKHSHRNDDNSPQSAFRDLYENVHDIKTKAALAEAAIQGILSSKDKAEFAKARLLETSASLTNLVSLIKSIGDLEVEMSGDYRYVAVAGILGRINNATRALERYVLIQKVDEMRGRLKVAKSLLRRKIFRTYREIGQIMEGVPTGGPGTNTTPHYSDEIITSLQDAHMVVECLGAEVVEDLMDEMVQTQMLPYDRMGREEGALYKLDKETFERRWAGLRRLLYAADTRMQEICPPGWLFPHRLYLEFADRTAQHFKSLLVEEAVSYRSICVAAEKAEAVSSEANGQGTTQTQRVTAISTATGLTATQEYVGKIVQALKSVLSVEEEMNARFEEDLLSLSAATKAAEEVLARLTEGKIMSSVFDDFMEPYVQLERKTVEETVKSLIERDVTSLTAAAAAASTSAGNNKSGAKSPTPAPIVEKSINDAAVAAAHQVYDSAGRMFETIRLSMKRCLALTCGKPFLSLSKEYRGCIQMYAEALRSRCPHSNETTMLIRSGKSYIYRMTIDDEVAMCRVINTSEYCAEVVPNLESQVKQKVDVTLEKEVDMSAQIELFTDVIAHAIRILVGGVLGQTEGALKVMKKIPWGTLQAVGDDSPYISMIKTILMDCIPRIRHALSPLWYKNFCTNFATEFLDQFLNNIMTQKKICPVGAEQLLLDTNCLKTMITQLHHIGLRPNDPKRTECPIPSAFTTVIGARFKHIEIVLKLVCTDEEQFEEMFAIMWPEGEVSDMQAILELKHNPSMISSAASAVGDISGATTRVAVGSTKSALGATSRAFGAVGSTSRALGGSMTKSLNKIKNRATRRSSMNPNTEVEEDN